MIFDKILKLLALCTVALLSIGMVACGSANRRLGTSSQAVTGKAMVQTDSPTTGHRGYLRSDDDTDADEPHRRSGSNDEQEVTLVGHRASPADKRAVMTVVRSYYAAATAGDGTKGCALLNSDLAAAIAGERSQPASSSDPCAKSLSLLFKQQHQHLVAEDFTTMVVLEVHISGIAAFAILGFRTMPESEIALQREGRRWKINALFDSTLP